MMTEEQIEKILDKTKKKIAISRFKKRDEYNEK